MDCQLWTMSPLFSKLKKNLFKMKKQYILFICLFVIGYTSQQANAQQIHHLTHYMLNDYAFNPAVAGSTNDVVTKFNFRKQWVGLNESPTTVSLSAHTNLLDSKAVGVGAIFLSDRTGPTKRTGVQLSYAYHLPIVENETYLGFGIGMNLLQYSIDFTDLILADPDDTQVGNNSASKFGADSNLGIYLHNSTNGIRNYWVGLSINQLFASKYKFDSAIENIQNDRHIYLTGGYLFNFSDNFSLEPSLMMKAVKGTNPQLDINARAIYKDSYWAGLSLRTADAIAILLGLNLNNGFNFAYSYDITTSSLNTVSSGTHEISLGYNIGFGRGE